MDAKRGATLVEVLVAGAILALLTLALFEGIVMAGRISRANAEILEAEGVAWDAAWAAFNEDYSRLVSEAASAVDPGSGVPPSRTVVLKPSAAPLISSYDTAPVLTVSLSKILVATNVQTDKKENFVAISADVEWGPAGARKLLSDKLPSSGEPPVLVLRSPLSRVPTY